MRGIELRLALGATLLLAACGQEASHVDHDHGDAPVPSSSTEDAALAHSFPQIPVRFHGDWDTAEGQCAQSSETRVSINEDKVLYYESIGVVRDVQPVDAEGISVTLAMSGEGESWERQEAFYLFDAGTSLVSGNETIRQRCP